MKRFAVIFLFSCMACGGSTDQPLTLADLEADERAEVISIEVPDELMPDSAFHVGFISRLKVKKGVVFTARGPKEAERGIIYGLDPDEGGYVGFYQPHAGMIKVKKLDE